MRTYLVLVLICFAFTTPAQSSTDFDNASNCVQLLSGSTLAMLPARLSLIFENPAYMRRFQKAREVEPAWNRIIDQISGCQDGSKCQISIHTGESFNQRDLEMEIKLEISGSSKLLTIEVPRIEIESLKMGDNSAQFNSRLTYLMSSIAVGIDLYLDKHPDVKAVQIVAGAVVNENLKQALAKLEFKAKFPCRSLMVSALLLGSFGGMTIGIQELVFGSFEPRTLWLTTALPLVQLGVSIIRYRDWTLKLIRADII